MKVKELPKAPIQIQRDELIAKVAELKAELAAKNSSITALQAELASKSKIITDKDNTITNLKAELNTKGELIKQKEGIILEKQNIIIKKDEDINGLKSELNLKDQSVTEQQNIITNLESTLALNYEAMAQKEHNIEDLKAQLFQLENDVVILGGSDIDEGAE